MIKWSFSKSILILTLILLVAASLRLYRIRDYLGFLGDEGRDALVWNNMVEKGKFTFLGPTASVGGFYLGPIYYYLALPFYFIFRDPVGPAVFVALTGVATVWLVYKISTDWFGKTAGLTAAWIYAIASLVVRYSRASWNPNPVPFFSLLGVYLAVSGAAERKWWKLVGAGICLGILWQLHYLTLILAPVYLIIILIYSNIEGLTFNRTIRQVFFLTVGWMVGFFPFLAFEVYHNFPNTRTVLEFVTRPGGAVLNWEILGLTRSVIRNVNRLTFTVFGWQDGFVSRLVSFIAAAGGTAIIIYQGRTYKGPIFKGWSLLIWFWLGIIIFSLYQGSISDYYFGFLFPVPAILLGAVAQFLWSNLSAGAPLVLLSLSLLTLDQSNRWFLRQEPNRLLAQTERIAREIISMSDANPYNFALITSGNSDHAYRYFLERLGKPPLSLEQVVTGQLIAVCEKVQSECQPLGNPVWEVAGFGRAELTETIIVPPGITIYRLMHHESSLDLIGKPVPK